MPLTAGRRAIGLAGRVQRVSRAQARAPSMEATVKERKVRVGRRVVTDPVPFLLRRQPGPRASCCSCCRPASLLSETKGPAAAPSPGRSTRTVTGPAARFERGAKLSRAPGSHARASLTTARDGRRRRTALRWRSGSKRARLQDLCVTEAATEDIVVQSWGKRGGGVEVVYNASQERKHTTQRPSSVEISRSPR
jgi:hypothetical protein